jgi:hypothetical protein
MCLISNGYLDQVQINVEETICPTIIQLIDLDIADDNGDDNGDIHTNAIGVSFSFLLTIKLIYT